MKKQYIVYNNQNDEIITWGTSKEICKTLNITYSNFKHLRSGYLARLKGKTVAYGKYVDVVMIEND